MAARRSALALSALAFVGAVAGCDDPTRPLAVSSAEWQGFGDAARASAAEHGSPEPDYVLSEPIDLDRAGVQTVVAGPVDAAPGALVTSGGVSFPPDTEDHAQVRVGPRAEPPAVRLVERSGETFVEVGLEVSEVERAYPGFQVWVTWGTDPVPVG